VRAGGREHAAHEPLISQAMLAEVPLAGLSFSSIGPCSSEAAPSWAAQSISSTTNTTTAGVLLQATVPVLADVSPESLAARVFAAECETLPRAIERIAKGLLP